ncbi:hypothetical protein [Rhizobium sp. AC44/96]|uniref:hypothetical protein n=1 Tax=Rhizobium sp. AC44/96 TaxID=1841654 RepID=UPI0011462733|nr:hypothetical protein [Rhizobium sp. AC44/96]
MKTIAYLTYGNRREYGLELTYSVMSAVHFLRQRNDNIQIVLITTAASRRDDLPVRHLIIDDDEMDRWMLDGKYAHAAKYAAFLRALDESQGQVILIDTDTYFTQHPETLFERIGPKRALMHDYDTTLGTHPEWTKLLAQIGGPIAGYRVDGASVMLNSGIVGADWSIRSQIDEVYDLMSGLFAIEPVFNIEQFAFSAVLGKYASLSVCPDVVRHYWGFDRPFVQAQIDDLFPQFSRDLFDQHVGQLCAFGTPPKPLRHRLRARLMAALRGNNRQYGFAYLSYLCALSSENPKLADAWANTALDVLLENPAGWADIKTYVRQDFREFVTERLEQNSWMQPATRQRWREHWGDAPLSSERQPCDVRTFA